MWSLSQARVATTNWIQRQSLSDPAIPHSCSYIIFVPSSSKNRLKVVSFLYLLSMYQYLNNDQTIFEQGGSTSLRIFSKTGLSRPPFPYCGRFPKHMWQLLTGFTTWPGDLTMQTCLCITFVPPSSENRRIFALAVNVPMSS